MSGLSVSMVGANSCRLLFFVVSAAWGFATSAQPVDKLGAGFSGQFQFKIPDGTVLSAVLTLPPSGTTSPVVVVMHGADGLGPLEERDAQDLPAKGYATVVVDSFSGRNVKAALGSGPRPRPQVRIADAYSALAVVRTHPAIDGARAFLLGRSHGGTVAMMAATKWGKDRFSADQPGFQAHIALYPPCTITAPEYDSLVGPLRLHLAAKDDMAPASQCEKIAARMASLGQPVSVTSYPGAQHAFDITGPNAYMGQWPSVAKCSFALPVIDAAISSAELAQCMGRGGTIGGDAEAAAKLRANILNEMSEVAR